MDAGKEISECRSYYIKVTCVIWCGKLPFWNLVAGAVGLRVMRVWGVSELLRRQSRRCWADTSW